MGAARASLEPGTVLQGTYEIVRRVGAGGMGEVFEARHARLPGRFAIKVLCQPVALGSPDFVRFRREAEIASSLRHPNIVQVVDFNQHEDGFPYIVMEFLQGADLAAELARGGAFPPRRALTVVEQVASALAAAHGQGVVHRDLKPQNVFLLPVAGKDGDFVKVVDFGISKVRTAATLSEESALIGTPQYMSPEQAEGKSADVDGRTDQFALAAITYEMLVGRPAFGADSVPAILHKICHEPPPPLAGSVAGVGPEADAVLRKALARSKDARFVTAIEFAEALAAALGRPRSLRAGVAGPGAPTLVGTTVAAAESAPAAATRRPPAVGLGLAAAGLGAVVLLALTANRGGREVAPPAPAEALSSPVVPATAAAPPVPVPGLQPDQGVPDAAPPTASSEKHFRSARAQRPMPRKGPLPPPEAAPSAPPSADGQPETGGVPAGGRNKPRFIKDL